MPTIEQHADILTNKSILLGFQDFRCQMYQWLIYCKEEQMPITENALLDKLKALQPSVST